MKHEPDYITNARAFLEKVNFEGRTPLMAVLKYKNEYKDENVHMAKGWSRFCIIYHNEFVIKFDRNNPGFGSNYSEYKLYKLAAHLGYEKLFAAMSRIKVRHKYYYVMPYIPEVNTSKDDLMDSDLLDEDEEEFLYETCRDLHCYNYGLLEGRPVLIDYADNIYRKGFSEDYEEE